MPYIIQNKNVNNLNLTIFNHIRDLHVCQNIHVSSPELSMGINNQIRLNQLF